MTSRTQPTVLSAIRKWGVYVTEKYKTKQSKSLLFHSKSCTDCGGSPCVTKEVEIIVPYYRLC